MKVKQLIKHLQKLDPEMSVYLSDDDEVNGVHDCFEPTLLWISEYSDLYSDEDLANMHKEWRDSLCLQKIAVL